ncbi:hypothetical protein BE04_24695 [Sorangium cellulosum]|uniref:Uncharacterized protein n=1 Tax=Sorangium cellulosum TaxID=56 RepID=A0A150P2S8_SORCE|nr:hypothetical protein BE04_24695 [Sorangium cellulosum]
MREVGAPDAEANRAPVALGLVAASVEAFDEARRTVTLKIARSQVEATLDPALSEAVVKTAVRRGERLVAQREDDGWVVLGALRTAPTPGIEAADEYVIEAKRVVVDAAHEVRVTSGASRLMLRAYGHIESLAQEITTRASGVHRIVGRMIRLN